MVEIDARELPELSHGKHQFKVGDWVIYGMDIGQITRLNDDGIDGFTSGWIDTSGSLADRFRPLTLAGKRIVESMNKRYDLLREIDGEAGFNYPDISAYFNKLVLQAIDSGAPNDYLLKATTFVEAAKKYTPVIDGVRLFRPKLGR